MKKKNIILLIWFIIIILGVISFVVISQKNKLIKNSQIKQVNTPIAETKVENKNEEKNISNFTINPYHPIFIGWDNGKGSIEQGDVLGGSKDGKWYKIKDFDIKYNGEIVKLKDFHELYYKERKKAEIVDLIKNNEDYKIYSDNKLIANTKGISQDLEIAASTGGEYLTVQIKPFESKKDFIIGVNGEWNALPRVPKLLSNSNGYSIDIDNDGKEELIQIEEKKTGEIKVYPGDIRIQKDVKSFIEKDGKKIYLQNDLQLDGIYFSNYKVYTMDLNGDKKLEIIEVITGHNTLIKVSELKNGEIVTGLGYYSGD